MTAVPSGITTNHRFKGASVFEETSQNDPALWVRRYDGTYVPLPESAYGGGGGGAAVTAAAKYSGGNVSIAAGQQASLPIDSLDFGTALLNMGNPIRPAVITAGVYAMTAIVNPPVGMNSGSVYWLDWFTDYTTGNGPDLRQTSGPAVTGATTPYMAVSVVWTFVAGQQMGFSLAQLGSSTFNFALELTVQRLA